jgi:hypothetical protein
MSQVPMITVLRSTCGEGGVGGRGGGGWGGGVSVA